MSEFPQHIFKAYDIRGIVDQDIDDNLTHAIGQALGSEVKQAGGSAIVIGRDGRLSGARLAKALANGLQAAGVDVIDIGLAPSPVVYYSSYKLGIPSCVAITGSHNPPDYNGFKMVIDGATLSAERIQAVKQRVLDKHFSSGTGNYREQPIIDDYIAEVSSTVRPARPIKLVIDCGNGVAGATAPAVFRGLGCKVIELYSDIDGTFPNHHPDPSQIENLQDLINAVQQHNADLGFAFDGDGDRLGVVANNGEIIWPDRQMILFAEDILSRNPGAQIIYDVKCSRLLATAIEQFGGQPTMWRTGHSFIKTKLKESDAAIAGEMSGHIFFKERWYGFDDGVYAGARLIELLSKKTGTPQQVFDQLPNSINTPELRIEFAEGEHYQFMEQLKACASFPDAQISTIDGLRVDYEDGFGLVRPSNTTPILVLRFEADTQAALQRIQQQFATAMIAVDATITLPF